MKKVPELSRRLYAKEKCFLYNNNTKQINNFTNNTYIYINKDKGHIAFASITKTGSNTFYLGLYQLYTIIKRQDK